jgi:DNA-binding GntR family transcriptional regulator
MPPGRLSEMGINMSDATQPTGPTPAGAASWSNFYVNGTLSADVTAQLAAADIDDSYLPVPDDFPALTRPDSAAALRDRRALMLLSMRDSGDRAPLSQAIFDDLAISIVEGRLRPRDSINSVELARRFGTSRTPVREALAELERHGVIVIPPRRRPYIAAATLKQVRDVYDVRASLFTLVSETIIDQCPKDRLAVLWKWQRALEDDVARKSSDDYFWHNVGFRLVEVRLTGNADLQRMLSLLGLRTLQFRHFSLSLPGRIERSLEDHRRLLEAYDEGDKVTATTMTRSLIMSGLRAIAGSDMFDGAGGEVAVKETT